MKKLALGMMFLLAVMMLAAPASAKPVGYTCGPNDFGTCADGESCNLIEAAHWGDCHCGYAFFGSQACSIPGSCGGFGKSEHQDWVLDEYACVEIPFACTPGEYRTQGDCVSACQSGGKQGCEDTCKSCAPECTLDTDCNGQKVCIAGECVNPSCGDGFCNGNENVFTCSQDCGEPQCGTDFVCDAGFECVDNACAPIPGYCDEDTDCASDEACGSDNQCYDPCVDIQCESYQTCEVVSNNPTCVGEPPDPCTGVICPTGQMCSEGNCIDDPDTFVISGHKYNDRNGNGQLDAGEEGLQGWTIEAIINMVPIVSTVTDENGYYALAIPIIKNPSENNHYDIAEVEQPGWKITYPTGCNWYCWFGLPQIDMTRDFFNQQVHEIVCGDDICDVGEDCPADCDSCYDVTCDDGFVCEAGSCVDDPDTIVMSGHKYNDLNKNGALDDGEIGVAGYEIRVYAGDQIVGSDVTDADGFYSIVVPTLEELDPGYHYDLLEVIKPDWIAINPSENDDSGYAGYCMYLFGDVDTTRDFFNFYEGSDCEPACGEGYTCVGGECVEDGDEDPYACEVDADCEQFNHGAWKCIDGQCRDPPVGERGGFQPYTEPACQEFINSLRPMDDIDPATLPELGLHDTYVSAAFKYASQFDCVGVAYYTRGEPSFDKDCTAAVWYNREQTELHTYGGMPILTAQNPAQAICFLAVKNVPNENSLPVEISITDSFGTKVAPIVSSDPVVWKCYALSDEFDECRLRDSYDPFQTWRNKPKILEPVEPVVVEEPVVEETPAETCTGLDICDDLTYDETAEEQS